MRVANPNPSHCSACFNQQPEVRHVDFEAAWDGPVIGDTRVAIDDLVLCEGCLKRAAELIGLTSAPRLKKRIAEVEASYQAVEDALQEARGYIDHLERALAARPTEVSA